VRGHPGVDVRHPAQRRVGARAAGARRPGGRRGEHGDPGADHPRPGRLRRRDPLRAGPGPKSRKKYLQVACTTLLTYYFPGARDLPSFKNFVYSDALYCRWLPAVVTRYQPSASMSLMISRTFRGNDHSILDGRRSSWDDPRSGAPCTSTLRDPCDSGSSPAGSLRRRNSGISRHYSTSGDQDAPGQRQDDRDGEELIEGGHVELRGGPGPRPPRRC